MHTPPLLSLLTQPNRWSSVEMEPAGGLWRAWCVAMGTWQRRADEVAHVMRAGESAPSQCSASANRERHD